MGGKVCLRCFVFCLIQGNFPANNLNFHWRWRWWDQIQDIFLNIFYFRSIFCLNGDCAFAATMLFNANENWIVIRGTFEYKKADNNCYAKAAMKKQWQTWQSPIFSQFINGRLTWKFSPQASNPTLMCERGPAEKI